MAVAQRILLLRYAFGLLLFAMGMHTIRQAARPGPLVIRYAHGHRITISSPKWYHRGLWACVGTVFLMGGLLFVGWALF